MPIPHVDNIPVPAPLWLVKVLLLLTLALHFVAVQILLGSLAAVCIFTLMSRSGNPASKTAASVVARRLTVVMTFVINLGIPPLLFAQVLYGRALYTSSVLIGAIWFSIIFLLMACYALMYRVQYRTAVGKPAFIASLIALIIAMGVGRILTMNMTLMLRPEVWMAMYTHSARGICLPPTDVTALPRWGFMMAGGLLIGGVWLILNSGLASIEGASQSLLRRTGAVLAILGGAAQLALGFAVYQTQPSVVQHGLASHPLYEISGIIWAACALLTLLLGGAQIGLKKFNPLLAGAGCLTGFVSICGAVLVRDGIRDITLGSKGFDVWARTVVANWGVLSIFFVLFALSIGVIVWLALVLKQARPIVEEVTV